MSDNVKPVIINITKLIANQREKAGGLSTSSPVKYFGSNSASPNSSYSVNFDNSKEIQLQQLKKTK